MLTSLAKADCRASYRRVDRHTHYMATSLPFDHLATRCHRLTRQPSWPRRRRHRVVAWLPALPALLLPVLLTTGALASGCASAPPPAAPAVSYEQKVAWIIRLEDQRVLRDTVPAPPPAPTVPTKKKVL